MASQTLPHPITFDEYLAIEEQAERKSEYRGGEMYAMSGGTAIHARLASRLIYLLQLQGTDYCQVFTSDLKLYVPSVNESMYPDVTVICGSPDFYGDRKDVVLNPTCLIEVLSPTSADYDKGLKAEFYRRIPTLRVLLLVDSQKRYVQTQTRQSDGSWRLEEFIHSEQRVHLDQWSFALDEIYSGILES